MTRRTLLSCCFRLLLSCIVLVNIVGNVAAGMSSFSSTSILLPSPTSNRFTRVSSLFTSSRTLSPQRLTTATASVPLHSHSSRNSRSTPTSNVAQHAHSLMQTHSDTAAAIVRNRQRQPNAAGASAAGRDRGSIDDNNPESSIPIADSNASDHVPFRLCLIGVTGRMGRQVVNSLHLWPDVELVCAVTRPGNPMVGQRLQTLFNSNNNKDKRLADLVISDSLEHSIQLFSPNVVLDLSNDPKQATLHGQLSLLQHRVPVIIGTSGLNDEQIASLNKIGLRQSLPVLVVPNFSVGAALQMRMSMIAAELFPDSVEIVETHHDSKKDSPSATAIATAEGIYRSIIQHRKQHSKPDVNQAARGYSHKGTIPIHSLRMKGTVAHQTVQFGADGESFATIHRIDDRQAYMNGVKLAIERIHQMTPGLHHGLESLLF